MRSLEKLLSKINRHVDEPREMLSESSMLAFTDDSQLTPIEPSKESPWERTGDIYKERLERIPSFAQGMVVKGIERFAEERNITLIDEAVVKKSREEMIEKRGAMFPFLKKFINSEK